MKGKIEGKVEGKVEGKAEGKIEGKVEGIEATLAVIRYLNEGKHYEEIALLTGLTIEQIKKIHDNLKK